jgi:hypothetical protein
VRYFQKKFPDQARTHRLIHETTALLKQPQMLEQVFQLVDEFYQDPEVRKTVDFETWPGHSTQAQLEKLLKVSDLIFDCHQDGKKLMVAPLSEIVFRSCGWGMFHDSYQPAQPVRWIGHDFVAQTEVARN